MWSTNSETPAPIIRRKPLPPGRRRKLTDSDVDTATPLWLPPPSATTSNHSPFIKTAIETDSTVIIEDSFPVKTAVVKADLKEESLKNAVIAKADLKEKIPTEELLKNAVIAKADLKEKISTEESLKNAVIAKADLKEEIPTEELLKNAVMAKGDLKEKISTEELLKNADAVLVKIAVMRKQVQEFLAEKLVV